MITTAEQRRAMEKAGWRLTDDGKLETWRQGDLCVALDRNNPHSIENSQADDIPLAVAVEVAAILGIAPAPKEGTNEKTMQLWVVYNGYTAETAVSVLAIAATEARAVELAREKFKAHWQADPKHDGERYYRNLTAEFICDAAREHATGVR